MKKILVFLLALIVITAAIFLIACDEETPDTTVTLYKDLPKLNYTVNPDGKTITVTGVKDKNITSIEIPDIVTSIGDHAFQYCYKLTSVTIPDSVTSIGDSAFQHCSALKSVTIPDSVTSIGNNAFCNTGYYNNDANWENGVLYIGKYLIEAKTTLSGSYTIKDGTTCIADYAFYVCSKLTSVTIPNSVTSIGEHAFSRCGSLTSVTIGNGVKSIDSSAFSGCSSLTSITIPDSVTSIGNGAFSYCSSLTSIKYRGTEQQWENISKYNIGYNGTITYNYTGN